MRFVFGNAGGFFENGPPIFRARAEDQIDFALLHDRVGAATHAGVGKQRLDIAEPAQRFVEQIFGITVAINAARYAHVVPVHAQLTAAVRKRERDFAEPDWFARIGPIENNVGHFAAAKRLGGLFAENPANGIEHVGFSAAVRSDDGGDSFVKFEKRFVREGFETDELERVKMHAAGATISLRAVTVA